MTLRARSCAAALVTIGLALYTESAHADAVAAGARAAPYCTVALAPSPAGVTLPANAPALLVVDRSYETSAPTVQATFLNGSTRTELAPTTDSHGLSTLAIPSASATPGTYSVEVTTSCPEMANEQKSVTPVTLTAPVSFPTSVGALVHVPTDPPTGIDKVRLEPTENMKAFLPAAQLDLVVNGEKSATTTFANTTSAIELVVNTGEACIENGTLHREKRVLKVTLVGAIAGVTESPAAASVDVPIDCGAIKWTSGLPLDKDGNPVGPKGTSTTPASSPSSSSSDSGCSAAPVTTHGGSSLLAFAIGGIALVAMRRRRRD